MKRVLFKVIVPTMFIAVWMWTCYLICNKQKVLTGFYIGFWQDVRLVSAECVFGSYQRISVSVEALVFWL